MSDLYSHTGKMALGSRLRRISERMTDEARKVYHMYGLDFEPKWFPIFYSVSSGQASSIKDIAEAIGQTHSSVSQIVKELVKAGLVAPGKDEKDGRKNIITLTRKGHEILPQLDEQYGDVSAAVESLLQQTRHDIWKAIEELEHQLNQQSLMERVKQSRKAREAGKVEIVDYKDRYAEDFKRLNHEWITRYFKLEEADHKALNNPRGYILDKGGYICLARYEGEIAGCCALINMDGGKTYELAKMAVTDRAKGRNIGWLLGQAVIRKARELGAEKVYLESNTILAPAINLYYKLGFKKVVGHETPYERCNIQMELAL